MENSEELFSKICRICLSVNNSRTVPLFEKNNNPSCYGQAITFCTNFELPHIDYAPHNMCYGCLQQLQQCIQLHKKCRSSQNYFKNISSNSASNLHTNIKETVIQQLYCKSDTIKDDKNNDIISKSKGCKLSFLRNPKPSSLRSGNNHLESEPTDDINNDITFDNDISDSFSNVLDDIKEEQVEPKPILEAQALKREKIKLELLHNDYDNVNNDKLFKIIDRMIKTEVKTSSKSKKYNINDLSDSSDEILAYTFKNKKARKRKKLQMNQDLKTDFTNLITDNSQIDTLLFNVDQERLNTNLRPAKEQHTKSVKKMNYKRNIIKKKTNPEKSEKNLVNDINNVESTHNTSKHLKSRKKSSSHTKTKDDTLDMFKRIIRNRNKLVQKMICDICNKIFTSRNGITRHLERHSEIPLFVCELCGKSFKTKAELGVHLVLTHDTGKHYPCEQCGFKAPRLFDLKEHKRIHTGERPFSCDKCSLTFRRRYVWQQHKIYHMEKSFQCPKCPLKFYKIYALRAHENASHERKYVYNCPICGMSYATNKSVRRHMVTKHGVARQDQGKIERVQVNSVINDIPI